MSPVITAIALHPREARSGRGDAVTFSIDGRLVRYEVWGARQDAYDADDEPISLPREYGEDFNEVLLTAYDGLWNVYFDLKGLQDSESAARSLTEAARVYNFQRSEPDHAPSDVSGAVSYPALLRVITEATGATPFKAHVQEGRWALGADLSHGRVLTVSVAAGVDGSGPQRIGDILRFTVRLYPDRATYDASGEPSETVSVPLSLEADSLGPLLRDIIKAPPHFEPRYGISEVADGIAGLPWSKAVAVVDGDSDHVMAYASGIDDAVLIVDALRKAHRPLDVTGREPNPRPAQPSHFDQDGSF